MQVIADDVSVDSFDVVVVGAGAAGLSAARQLEELDVAVLADAAPVCGGSSGRARGGIAAPVGGDDAPQLHARDTRSAGAGLCAPGAVDALVSNAERTIREMQSLGVEFDRDDSGELELGREAAHSRARIVHAGGDAIGVSLTEALASDVFDGTSEPVLLEGEMLDVCAPEGRVEGVVYRNARGDVRAAAAPAVVLATGGVGWMYGRTTNPPQSTG
ncbi:MAG: FAD-dependent oxidoreductase, partial [Bradymonadaceae bacterium]